jgi:hypothetical protein
VHRHDLDPVALVFGATFVGIGLAYAIAHWSWIGSAHGWVLGLFLIIIGVAGAVSATTRDRRRERGGVAERDALLADEGPRP